ncbi:MAG: hypothetical protein RLZZ214_942, partial [Verrucomicrobiota bacterium]
GSTRPIRGEATGASGGLLRTWDSGSKIVVGGALNLSDGGTLRLLRSQSPAGGGVFENIVTLNGGLNITNQTSGAYTPITLDFGTGNVQKGGQLVLNGDVTFTGNSTNFNTTTIDGPRGSGTQGVIALTGSSSGTRTFNVGNGAAAVDLAVTAPLADGAAVTSGLTKTGLGTLALTGDNSYTGSTTVSNGQLMINGNSSTATGNVSVAAGATLGGSGTLGGATTLNGILAPGNSIGTLTVSNDVTWNGAAAAGATTDWQFELGLGNASDMLDITGGGGDFLKGSGTIFRFDFLGGTDTGTYTLVDWTATTDFASSDFSYTNLGGGNSGSFSITGSQLNFTVVPEPNAAILVGGFGVIALLRRRRWA